MPEVFAVGDTLALVGELGQLPVQLSVIDPEARAIIEFTGSPRGVAIHCRGEDLLGPARATEALRMAFRVAQKAWGESVITINSGLALPQGLAADGFVPGEGGGHVRHPQPLALTGPKAATSVGAYAHVLDVHWNFVPAEVATYEPLLALPPMRILDLGSGFGKNARVMSRSGHTVMAVELAGSAVTRARALLPGVRAVVASAVELPFATASFDAVVDVGCLHCMSEDERLVAVCEIARMLTGGGVLYSRIFKPRPEEWVNRQPFHATRFGMTTDEVRELFSRHLGHPVRWRADPSAHYVRVERPGVM